MIQKMRTSLIHLWGGICQERFFPLILLFLALISFGIFIPTLGLYSDDWHYYWLAYHLDYVERFFTGNRPFLGVIYDILTKLMPSGLIAWHTLLFLLKISSAVLFWVIMKKLLPRQTQIARWISLLYLFYPGNLILYQPLVFIVAVFQINFFLLSFLFTIMALQKLRQFWIFTIAALALSLSNLVLSEYFFFLELLRPLLIWVVLSQGQQFHKKHVSRTLLHWLPYLVLFASVLIWRFFFQSTLASHQAWLLQEFLVQPAATLKHLITEIGTSLRHLFLTAWNNPFLIDQIYEPQQLHITIYFLLLFLFSTLFLFFYFFPRKRSPRDETKAQAQIGSTLVGFGLLAILLGGAPIWLAKFSVDMGFRAENRFVMPFIFGTVLTLVGIIYWFFHQRTLRNTLLTLCVAAGIAFQFIIASQYQLEWERLKTFYWQMFWRIPSMETGLHLIANPLPTHMEGENSISAGINMIYAQHTEEKMIDYYLYFLQQRMENELGELVKNKPLSLGHQIGEFSGDRLRLLAFTYQPPACLRILDPALEEGNPDIPGFVTSASRQSDLSVISDEGNSQARKNIERLFRGEPQHTWCYSFEKADLARQMGQWSEVIRLYRSADEAGFQPQDQVEWLPLIEAWLHTAEWEQAQELTLDAYSEQEGTATLFCSVWEKLKTTEDIPVDVYDNVYQNLNCITFDTMSMHKPPA
jgi:hypothetical protein